MTLPTRSPERFTGPTNSFGMLAIDHRSDAIMTLVTSWWQRGVIYDPPRIILLVPVSWSRGVRPN